MGVPVFLLGVLFGPSVSSAALGDVDEDGSLSMADALRVQRHVAGELSLSAAEEAAADVAPWSAVDGPAPDGEVDAGDVVVLLRAISGEISLVPPPVLDAIPSPTTANPQAVTGSSGSGYEVTLYVNGQPQATTTASAGTGAFSFSAILDDANEIHAIASDGVSTSDPSTSQNVAYQNTTPRIQGGTVAAGVHVWTPGNPATPYSVTSTLVVPTGATLILQPGVELRFLGSTQTTGAAELLVNGTLRIQGTAGGVVRLVPETAGTFWNGIRVNGTSATATIESAYIERVFNGIRAEQAWVSVRNSEIRNFAEGSSCSLCVGIRFDNAPGEAVGNLIHRDPPTRRGSAIHVDEASPLLQGNIIRRADEGMRIVGPLVAPAATPSVLGNLIEDNNRGIQIERLASPTISGVNVIRSNTGTGINVQASSREPMPVINGNDIYANGPAGVQQNLAFSGYVDASDLVVNAEGNWWGFASAWEISRRVWDFKVDDSYLDRPHADVVPFLDGPVAAGGGPVAGSFLHGPVTQTLTTLSPGTVYDVVGSIVVPEGKTLSIPQNVTLRIAWDAEILVDGLLSVAGAPGSRVVLTSLSPSAPSLADYWDGLVVRSSPSLSIDQARILYANQPIFATNTPVTVRDSEITYFNAGGIRVVDGTATITGNLIDRESSTSGHVVRLEDTGGTISGNTISQGSFGIYLIHGSSPLIENNTITGNGTGLYLQGSGSAGGNPVPVLRHNRIYANSQRNLNVLQYYHLGSTDRVDARENFWGTETPAGVRATILANDLESGFPIAVDFSNFTNFDFVVVPGTHLTNTVTAVRHDPLRFRPGAGETGNVRFELLAPSSVTVRIYDEATNALTREIVTSLPAGDQVVPWDGRDGSGVYAPANAYYYRIDATDGANVGIYTTPSTMANPVTGVFGAVPNAYNVYANDFVDFQMDALNAGARPRIEVRPDGEPTFRIDGGRAYPKGVSRVVWDGRRPDGSLIGNKLAYVYVAVDSGNAIVPNSFVVEPAPTVGGVAPVVEVKADPYRVHHSYDQISRIAYRIDQPAVITLKLLPPGVADFADPSAVVLIGGELQQAQSDGVPIDHVAEWSGYDPNDPTPANVNEIRTLADGVSTFAIQAVSAVTGHSTLYRGVIDVRR